MPGICTFFYVGLRRTRQDGPEEKVCPTAINVRDGSGNVQLNA